MKETPSSSESISRHGIVDRHPRISSIVAGTGLLVGAIGINFLADRAIELMPQDLAVEIIHNAVRLGIFYIVVKIGTPLLRKTNCQTDRE